MVAHITLSLLLGVGVLSSSSNAFTTTSSRTPDARPVCQSRLCAESMGEAENENLSRRDANSKFAMLASAFATTFNGIDAAVAEDASDGGRLIEFEVSNLDGGGSGKFVIKTRPDWAPKGAQRFEELTEKNFWEGCRIFRVLPGFVSQFGITGDPQTQAYWRSKVRVVARRQSPFGTVLAPGEGYYRVSRG